VEAFISSICFQKVLLSGFECCGGISPLIKKKIVDQIIIWFEQHNFKNYGTESIPWCSSAGILDFTSRKCIASILSSFAILSLCIFGNKFSIVGFWG